MKSLKVKSVVNALFEFYSKYLSDLYVFCIFITSISFVSSALLYKYSAFGKDFGAKNFNYYDAIFSKFSYGGVYSIVDFSKPVFLFLITLLSVAFFRYVRKADKTNTPAFKIFFQNIKPKDFFILIPIAAIACMADMFLFQADAKIKGLNIDQYNYLWIHYTLSILRLNIPMIISGIAVAFLAITNEIQTRGRSIITLIISVWLYNVVAYEVASLIGSVIIFGVGDAFNNIPIRYIVESVLYIPIVAFFIPGYAAVFYYPFKFYEEEGRAK